MASIVVQEQDLFFEFDFGKEITEQNKDKKIEHCKEDVFLIGCYRNDQKHQLDWIRSQGDGTASGKYNVRLGKGRDGWINKDNPRIANPQYLVLYEFGKEDNVYYYKINAFLGKADNHFLLKYDYVLSGKGPKKFMDALGSYNFKMLEFYIRGCSARCNMSFSEKGLECKIIIA